MQRKRLILLESLTQNEGQPGFLASFSRCEAEREEGGMTLKRHQQLNSIKIELNFSLQKSML